eukprot:COSAG01_NODE_35779_length_526_cov_3.093677_1_plen_38_part_10
MIPPAAASAEQRAAMHETVGRSQPVTVGLLRTLPTVRI